MDKTKEDLRTIRTKRDLINALEELLNQYNFDDLSIKDITDKAMISKNTFYNNYNDKSELLIALFKKYSDSIMSDLEPYFTNFIYVKRYVFLRRCIKVVLNKLYNVKFSLKRQIENDNSKIFFYSLNVLIQLIIDELYEKYSSVFSNEADRNILNIFYSGAIANMIYFGIKNDINITEGKLCKNIYKFIYPVVL